MMLTRRWRSEGGKFDVVSGGQHNWNGSTLAGAAGGMGCCEVGGAGKFAGDGTEVEGFGVDGFVGGDDNLAAGPEAPHVEPRRGPSPTNSRFTSVTDILSVLHFFSASVAASNCCLRETFSARTAANSKTIFSFACKIPF